MWYSYKDSEGYHCYHIETPVYNTRPMSEAEIKKIRECVKKGVKFALAFLAAVFGGSIVCLFTDSIEGFIIGAIVMTIVKIIIEKFAKKHPKLFKFICISIIIGICILLVLPGLQ